MTKYIVTTRKTTTREFDADGRVTSEVVEEETITESPTDSQASRYYNQNTYLSTLTKGDTGNSSGSHLTARRSPGR